MAEVSVEVSGHMEAVPELKKNTVFPSFLQIPTQMPDPKEWIQQQRQNVRPWLVFVQTSNFKVPPSIPRLGLVIYCLITSPLILLALAGTFYAGYKLNQRNLQHKLVLFGKELTLAQQYGVVALCSMPVYYVVGAHGAMFWVIGASIVIITLHAAFYNIEALAPRRDDEFPLLEEV